MYNFKEVERQVADLWKKNGIPEKVRKKSFKNSKKYYFMDGPPYATGHIHMGTALNKILKDMAIRSRRMQDFNVFDRPGYDTHGVPIELKVEKEIGVKTKKDIESYGINKFVSKCRKFATEHIGLMNEEFANLGVWMDWGNPYLTLDNRYIESVWWTFKMAEEKNLLYLGKYPVHVCPRCETAVAYNEIIYKKLEDNSIYVKFPLEEEKNKFLIIWTTTPWTLPGNTAVMIHPEFDYVEIETANNGIFILAKELHEKLMNELNLEYTIKREFKGKEMEGRGYINPLSNNLKVNTKNAYKIIASTRYVNLEEGTGLVHCAPGHGKEDYDASRPYNTDILCPVGINGNMGSEAGKYSGKKARIVDKEIIEDLEKDGFLVHKKMYSHDYPLCWRCESPLLMISVPQWFFRIESIHEKLLEENERVNWIPSWAKDRMQDWLRGIGDWPISRQRYWGTPLPIWICKKCGDKKVIGSIKELEKLSGGKVKELHKPEIDEIKIKCKCNGIMERVPEVLDVWFDSGVSSWAALNFQEKGDLFKKLWPADFNLEGTDQFRGWWNSQLILSVISFDRRPFDTIYVHGMVLDLGKKKMSKSLGNVVSPSEVIEKFGRDALRFYFSLVNPGDNISYDEAYFKEISKFFNVLINVQNLISSEYGLEFTHECNPKEAEDKWIISRLNDVSDAMIKNYNSYLFCKNSEMLSKFIIDDVSRAYIQIVRERINNKDKSAGEVLNNILSSVLVLAAPIIPHLTDYFYRKMNGKEESIHLCSFPIPDKKKIDKKLEQDMIISQNVIEKILAERAAAEIGIRWPLAKAVVYAKDENKGSLQRMQDIIKSQVNVKFLEIRISKEEKVQLDTKITPELEAEGFAREISRCIQDARKKAGLNKEQKINLLLQMDDELHNLLKNHVESIKKKVGASKIGIKNIDDKVAETSNCSETAIKGRRVIVNF